jgi:hypothetical protein
VVGKNGNTPITAPLDKNVLDFLGVDAESPKGSGSQRLRETGEILAWMLANAKTPRLAPRDAATF